LLGVVAQRQASHGLISINATLSTVLKRFQAAFAGRSPQRAALNQFAILAQKKRRELAGSVFERRRPRPATKAH
jgi:hypothetical protein